MSCKYCEDWHQFSFRYADGILGELDMHIENNELFVQLGNDEAVMHVSYCPSCGEYLGGDAEAVKR